MAAPSKQEHDSEDVQKPVVRPQQSPSILALGKLFPASPTLDHAVRFLSQVRGTDKLLMVRGKRRITTDSIKLGETPTRTHIGHTKTGTMGNESKDIDTPNTNWDETTRGLVMRTDNVSSMLASGSM